MTYFLAILCVVGIASGQLLFKMSAKSLQDTGSLLHPQTASIIFLALALYGLTTIAWIWVLQKLELGKAYPLMALAFVLVPVGSHFVFGERFSVQYFIGILILITGILVTTRS